MKPPSLFLIAGLLAVVPLGSIGHAQALTRDPAPATPAEVAAAKQAVEAAPDSPAAHDQYAKVTAVPPGGSAFLGARDPKFFATKVEQYEAWDKQFPNSAEVAFRLGALFSNSEDPRAKPYLLKALELDPKRITIYPMLSIDAARWGDAAASREYIHKATLAAPDNADYAFSYVFSFRETSEAEHTKWQSMVQDFVKQFPTSNRGAQALYWLAYDNHDDNQKIAIFEQLRAAFPPAKFGWSADGMTGLFDVYLRTSPSRAFRLALDMKNGAGGVHAASWGPKLEFAGDYVDVLALLVNGRKAEARARLDQTEAVLGKMRAYERGLYAPVSSRLKAAVLVANGNMQGAYDMLVDRFAVNPDDATRALTLEYGAKIGKTEANVDTDVWTRRNTNAKPAPKFDLAMYTAKKNLSLDDLHGKVVLLTFWFPGCGPCRGEFPHFENVLEKFHGKDVTYVGINVFQGQDLYVLPFMDGTKYTFIPLRGDDKLITKAYNVRGEPSNFLIDQNGRIVYSDFRASDPDSELLVQRMIESLLAHPGKAS